jgi:hypothetical protein
MTDWIIKSISLTPKEAEIAKNMNLSKFCRECLNRYDAHLRSGATKHTQPGVQERQGYCRPKSGCLACWPDGAPSEEAFDLFLGRIKATKGYGGYEGPEVGNHAWLGSLIPTRFGFEGIVVQGNAKRTPKSAKKGFWGRLLSKES